MVLRCVVVTVPASAITVLIVIIVIVIIAKPALLTIEIARLDIPRVTESLPSHWRRNSIRPDSLIRKKLIMSACKIENVAIEEKVGD